MGKDHSGYTSRGDGEYTESDESEVDTPQNSKANKENLLTTRSTSYPRGYPSEPLYSQAARFVCTFGWIYYHKEEDVKKFFEGFKIVQIFLHDLQGFTNGVCFVQFENVGEVDRALEKDKMLVGERCIKVEKVLVQKLKYLANHLEENKKYLHMGFILLAGLPSDCTNEVIKDFLPDIKIEEIVYGEEPRKHQSYLAFLRLTTKDDENKALNMFGEKQCGFIGNHYIKIIPLAGAAFNTKKKEMMNPTNNQNLRSSENGKQKKKCRNKAKNAYNNVSKIQTLESSLRQRDIQLIQNEQSLQIVNAENDRLRKENEQLRNANFNNEFLLRKENELLSNEIELLRRKNQDVNVQNLHMRKEIERLCKANESLGKTRNK